METRLRRRDFLRYGTATAVGIASLSSPVRGAARKPDGGGTVAKWRAMRDDPVRKAVPERPQLDEILALFPRTTGPPAFPPEQIAEHIEQLRTTPEVNTGHHFLDLSVKVGLAHIEATFQGDHPKYGVGVYVEKRHDGFPPTIIASVDALSAWGLGDRAAQLFGYWLATFVREDGTIEYYGPSISEYGQLLHTAALLCERTAGNRWWHEGFQPLDRIAEYLLGLHADAVAKNRLIAGSPEADTRHDTAQYFHNNGWVVKGLRRWAELCRRKRARPTTTIATVERAAKQLAADTLRAIARSWPEDPADWWLPPQVEPLSKPSCLTDGRVASYTNYRYWPELLSCELLPKPLANRVVDARLTAGGQFCGMTRFADHLDDWPLAEYLYGVWKLGRKNDFLLSLYGHVAYHQAQRHLTAYEQVSFPPGKPVADYCLPCQLVAARAARLLLR